MEGYLIVAGVGPYYATFTVVECLSVFINETACKTITDSLNFRIQKELLYQRLDRNEMETCGRVSAGS